jgi:hypothetical protein
MKARGHWKHCPAITKPRTKEETDKKIAELYNDKEFIASIDKVYLMAGMKTAETILLKAMDECSYEVLSPAHDVWIPIGEK